MLGVGRVIGAVLRLSGVQPLPAGTRGAGSCWPVVVMVLSTAGLMTSSSGLG